MDYTTLITSEHADKPNFVATVVALTQGLVDYQSALSISDGAISDVSSDVDAPVDSDGGIYTFGALPGLLDLDVAIGSQLDAAGVWIGIARTVNIPSLGATQLNDDDYRAILRAKIAANHWDGSMSGLQTILGSIFPGTGLLLYAVDNYDMSMYVCVSGGVLSAIQLAMLVGGLLTPRPEGVLLSGVVQLDAPLFGLDINNAFIGGLDVGQFALF